MIKRIYIEITNICNLRCSFCTVGQRSPGYMTLEQLRSILPAVREITEYIYLHVQGEPLTHPDFDAVMDLCDEAGMKVQLVTNGVLLDRCPGLISHPSLRRVSFSLQSIPFLPVPPEEYLGRIISFCREASRNGRPYCELRVWRSDTELPQLLKQTVLALEDSFDFADSARRDSYKIMDNVFVSFSDSFTWPSLEGPFISSTGTCRGGRDQIAILYDGTVVPCCLDARGVIRLGNIFETPLPDILAGQRYQALVTGFQNNKAAEDLCRHCSYRSRFASQKRISR